MVEVTLDLLGAIAPQFANMTPERLEALNMIASVYVSDVVFGEHAAVARAFVIAHLATIGDNGGSGAVKSESVADLSTTYAMPDGTDGWGLTSYGQEFMRICEIVAQGQKDLFIPPARFTLAEE